MKINDKYNTKFQLIKYWARYNKTNPFNESINNTPYCIYLLEGYAEAENIKGMISVLETCSGINYVYIDFASIFKSKNLFGWIL